ncbi:MAG TPA: CdaR family protein [Blastocatellia bacterium]|nr:CdaR family protein [Blastocatellia bacterium]
MRRWLSPPRLLQRLRHLHFDNLGLKLLALMIAVLLFIVSRQPISDVRLSGVPLEFRGLNPGAEISGDVLQTVSVRLRGPSDLVRSLTPNQLSVVANLNNLRNKEPGEHRIQLRSEDVLCPDNVQVQQIDPASIWLKLEKTISRQVSIKPELVGRVADGMEIYNLNVEPSTAEIEGPQSLVDQVEFVSTEPVNLNGRNSFRLAVDLETPHNSLRVKNSESVFLSAEIGERRGTRSFTQIPVSVPHQSAGVRLLTKMVGVELYGPQSVLAGLKPSDLHIELNTTGLQANSETVPLQASLPSYKDKNIIVKEIIPKEVRLKRQ